MVSKSLWDKLGYLRGCLPIRYNEYIVQCKFEGNLNICHIRRLGFISTTRLITEGMLIVGIPSDPERVVRAKLVGVLAGEGAMMIVIPSQAVLLTIIAML